MAESQESDQDHDQRLKVLLKEFFEAFFRCFFADMADWFEFSKIEWLDKEVFTAPPQGERRVLDLIAQLRLRTGAPRPRAGVDDLVALVHVEIESRDSVAAFRPRMFDYYVQLRRDTGLPVLPIALLLRVGQGGNTWDSYDEFFGEHHVIRFRYASVGLPGLKAEDYATGENLLGVALSALMEQPAASERKAELYAGALKRIAGSGENDFRRFLLAECLEAYAPLDESEGNRVRALLQGEGYREVEPLMKTTYERGIEAGQRGLTLQLLEDKFGPLPAAVKERVEAMSREELSRLLHEFLRADDLGQLGLGD